MKAADFSVLGANKRSGYALLLGLVIVVAIGMLIYYMNMYGPVREIGKGESNIEPPWRQWHKMQVRLHRWAVGEHRAEQPQLSEPLEVEAECLQDGENRGQIGMVILADGTVEGGWGGEFFINRDVEFQVMSCEFEGSIDPEHVYSDENGEDLSRLFFIAKGHFVILESNNDTGRTRSLTGDAYVRGWLDVDNWVEGEIILTSDKRSFYRYIWQGQRVEAEHNRQE